MSSDSRRANVELSFAGVNVTESIRPYILSVDYTDNENDETDDLQIKLQDREGQWLERWLDELINTAATQTQIATVYSDTTTGGTGNGAGAGTYICTARIGLNVRSGPGMNYGIVGGYAYNATVTVYEVANGWAKVKMNGNDAYCYAQYLQLKSSTTSDDGDASYASETVEASALQIQAVIVADNWNTDGKQQILDCGIFELDNIKFSGPPSTLTLKATSLPFSKAIRQTKKSKAWESYRLSGIAKEMAKSSGMSCLYESSNDPFYTRVEQYKESDIACLKRLADAAGISLKATNNIIVLFDQATYEQKDSSFTIHKYDGTYMKYSFSTGSADTEYQSCRVSYVQPNGALIEGFAYIEDYDADSEDNQQLEITAHVSSVSEAETLAQKHLRLHNKFEKTADFTLLGRPNVVAGLTVMVEEFGCFDGKYIVTQSKHSVGSSGYTTTIKLRKVLEGY